MKKKNFIPIAKDVIESEIKSLKKLKLSINQSFNKVVEAIINCKNGKIIISGIGKSGIIGKLEEENQKLLKEKLENLPLQAEKKKSLNLKGNLRKVKDK